MVKSRLNTISKKLGISVLCIGIGMSILTSILLYPIIYNILKENAIQNVSQINYQSVHYIDYAMDQYEIYNRFINNDEYLYELIKAYQQEETIVNYERISARLSDYTNQFSGISYLFVLLEDGETTLESIGGRIDFPKFINSDWYHEYKEAGYSRQFSQLVDYYGEIPQAEEDASYIFLASPFQNKSIRGDLVFLLPFSVFNGAIQTYQENNMDIILYGRNNLPIYTNTDNPGIDLKNINQYLIDTGKEQEISENGEGVDLISYSELGSWKLVVNVSQEFIMGNFKAALFLIYGLQLAVIIILVFGILFTITKILKPLRLFTKRMDQVTSENIDVRVEIQSGDELEKLAGSFNRMIDRIQKYVCQQAEFNQREKQMEYTLFVAQVDPHFIYKTLNILTYFAKKNRNEELIQVNESLINILMDRLRISTMDVFDTVEKEVEVVESYLEIQKVRYGEFIRFEKEIDKDILSEKIPKNIIQPFIENSIFHGLLLNIDEDSNIIGGVIQLNIREEKDMIKIQITDNGQGMDKDVLEHYFVESPSVQEEKGRHIGIRNIRERLSYLYGDDFSIHAVSSKEVGTKIVIYMKRKREV